VGGLLARLASAHGLVTGHTVVTYVPAGRRARGRGFDHAGLIASATAHALGSPLRRLVVRVADGPRQADVANNRRRANVRERFASRSASGHVLLVDDVFTTGATAEACSLALLEAGADAVDVVTWARTLRRWTPRFA
jgi:predicted amidophosphoribosyltransferase